MGKLNAKFVYIVNHLICSIESKEKPNFSITKSYITNIIYLLLEYRNT